MVRGNGPIVMRVENNYGFYEHDTIANANAKAEAARLAQSIGGTFVVLVPVAVIAPAPKTVERALVSRDAAAQLDADLRTRREAHDDDDLPF